jgi:hypothetical protein
VYGENTTDADISEVEVRLEPSGDRTTLVLDHAAVIPDEMWEQYGPGAAGVGWDPGPIALGWHLHGAEFDAETWENRPDARRAAARSVEAAGEPPDTVAKQVAGSMEVLDRVLKITEGRSPIGPRPSTIRNARRQRTVKPTAR